MIAWLSGVWSRFWLDIVKWGAIIAAGVGLWFIGRLSGKQSVKVDELEEDLQHAKEIIRQDRIVGTGRVERMRKELSEFLRRQRDS